MSLNKLTSIGVAVLMIFAIFPAQSEGSSLRLTPEEMSDWRYPAILCRDAVTILTVMMSLEKILPGSTNLIWEKDPEKAFMDTVSNALRNKTTYDNVFNREVNFVDGTRTSTLVWFLYDGLEAAGYKMVDNEKLPIDAFDWCTDYFNEHLAPD